MRTAIQTAAAVCFTAALASGCASNYPAPESEFGGAVRQMVSDQTYDPAAGERASAKATPGLDGAKAAQVLQEYRQDVTRPKGALKDIEINVGR